MPVPDAHAGEPTVEIPKDRYEAWRNADDAAKKWRKHADNLRQGLIDEYGENAYAFMVGNEKVISYRYIDSYAEASLIKAYPDLCQHFMVDRLVQVLDVEAMLKQHPDIVALYRVRQFRNMGE